MQFLSFIWNIIYICEPKLRNNYQLPEIHTMLISKRKRCLIFLNKILKIYKHFHTFMSWYFNLLHILSKVV